MKGGTPNSYRTLQEVYLLPNSATYQYPYSDTGYTNQFYLPSPANGKYITNADYDGKTNDCHLWTGQAKSAYGQSGNFANFTPTPGTGKITANFNGSDSNPLAKPASGAIKWNVSITVDKTTGYSSHVFVSGGVTCYPSHEIIVNNTLVGYYDAPPNPSITLLTNCLILAGPSYPLLGSGTTSSGAVVPVY